MASLYSYKNKQMDKVFREDSIIVRITSAACFLIFTFLYLYNYQTDVLAMAQHVLSDGKTYYVPFVGASLITILLFLLQLLIARFLQLKTMFHALTYFPSLLILAIITDVSPDIDRGFSFGAWLWVVPLLMVVWLIGSWIAKAWEVYEPLRFSHGFFSRAVWMNLAQFALMFVLVGMVGNSNEVFHYRMAVERSLVKGDYKKALTIGEKSLTTDSSLTMLRIYALAANKQLPERLFEYPLVGGSEAMKPNGTSVKMMLYTDTKLRLLRKSKTDYQLCAYLLDRNLDGFGKAMVKIYGKPTMEKKSKTDPATPDDNTSTAPYTITKALPKHYREALVLYTHLRSNPLVDYHDDILDADYRDFQDLEHKYANPQERKNMIRDTYGKTYWYYYDYR